MNVVRRALDPVVRITNAAVSTGRTEASETISRVTRAIRRRPGRVPTVLARVSIAFGNRPSATRCSAPSHGSSRL